MLCSPAAVDDSFVSSVSKSAAKELTLQQTYFITGTDTGVGKTVLTALLLSHLRQSGCSALAIKPFCSGGRGDAHLLHSLQNDDLTLDQINPFYFLNLSRRSSRPVSTIGKS